METKEVSLSKTAVQFGLYTAAGMAAFRLLASFVNFGLVGSPELLNVLILVCGIVSSLGYYRRHLRHPLPYWKGMRLGMLTTLVTMVGYAAFAFGYFTFVTPSSLHRAVVHYPVADQPNGLEIAVTSIIEGLAYGVIVTLAAVQYFTPDRTNKTFDEAYE